MLSEVGPGTGTRNRTDAGNSGGVCWRKGGTNTPAPALRTSDLKFVARRVALAARRFTASGLNRDRSNPLAVCVGYALLAAAFFDVYVKCISIDAFVGDDDVQCVVLPNPDIALPA